MDRKLFLVRHGQIDYGSEKRYIGITDLPLCDAGILQAMALKEYFSSIEFEKVFVSPLVRCLQTAELILLGRNTERIILEDLKEIHMGEWENQTMGHIKKHYREMYENRGATLDSFIPPGGESFEQLQKRAAAAFDQIASITSGNVLIISHAGVNRVILSKLLGLPLKDLFKIEQTYGCINQLSWDLTCPGWKWEKIRIK